MYLVSADQILINVMEKGPRCCLKKRPFLQIARPRPDAVEQMNNKDHDQTVATGLIRTFIIQQCNADLFSLFFYYL